MLRCRPQQQGKDGNTCRAGWATGSEHWGIMSVSAMNSTSDLAAFSQNFAGGAPLTDRAAEQTLLIQKVADLRGLVSNVEGFLAAAVVWKDALANFGAVCM